VRVSDDGARRSLDELLTLAWSPDVDHWSLEADGTWTRTPRRTDLVDYQRELIHRHRREA